MFGLVLVDETDGVPPASVLTSSEVLTKQRKGRARDIVHAFDGSEAGVRPAVQGNAQASAVAMQGSRPSPEKYASAMTSSEEPLT